jgi:hypothetical protein
VASRSTWLLLHQPQPPDASTALFQRAQIKPRLDICIVHICVVRRVNTNVACVVTCDCCARQGLAPSRTHSHTVSVRHIARTSLTRPTDDETTTPKISNPTTPPAQWEGMSRRGAVSQNYRLTECCLQSYPQSEKGSWFHLQYDPRDTPNHEDADS